MYSGNDPRLELLLEGIVRLAAGDLSTRVEVSEARDEIDAVIMGTNLLAEDLQIVYEELEQRVQARTQQLNEAHLAMRRMAMTDPLTGLHNRSAFAAALNEAQAGEADGKKRAAILLLDMDGFKAINDSLGHTIGDKVLETVAGRISGAVREQDMVARMGGDNLGAWDEARASGQRRAQAAPPDGADRGSQRQVPDRGDDRPGGL